MERRNFIKAAAISTTAAMVPVAVISADEQRRNQYTSILPQSSEDRSDDLYNCKGLGY